MEDDRRELTPAKAQYIPQDRFNLVYCIFYLLGIGSLMPWNFFITAKEYFQFKLRNTTIPVDYSVGTVGSTTELQASFESYIAIASCVPNFLFNLLNAVSTNIIPLKVRMVVSLLIMLVMFAVTDGIVFVNTDTWQSNFFILTIATVVITSAATSVMGGALFGLSGQFPPRYTQAAMSGQAMGGTFAALADIFSLAGGSTVIDSAFGFFLSAVIVILASLIGFIALHYIDFSQFFMGKSPTGPLVHSINYSVVVDSETSSTDDQDESDANSTPPVTFRGSIGTVFKNVWPQAVAVLSVFAVTLSVFPGVCSAIQSNHRDSGSDLTNKYFSPLVCFLLFNTGDWAGRIVAGWIDLLRPDRPARLLAVTALRVGFVPLIMLCNAQPRSHLPIIFYSDFIPVIFISFLGLTNGYVSTLAMMHAPQKVSFQLAEVAGSWMAVFISGGLALGSLLSLGLVKLL